MGHRRVRGRDGVKSGPGFQKARGSALVAVMRRDRDKAEDFARRHGVARVHAQAEALIHDPEVDAVYIATPPSSHDELARQVAAAGKPCLVEKPMARSHAECARMNAAFRAAGVPLFVVYTGGRSSGSSRCVACSVGRHRRGDPVHVRVAQPLASGEEAANWRFNPAVSGAGLFYDLGSHCLDLLDFQLGPIADVSGVAVNTGRAYPAEDVSPRRSASSGGWPGRARGTSTPIGRHDGVHRAARRAHHASVHRRRRGGAGGGAPHVLAIRNPPHVHQPLIQSIVDELRGRGRCESTGESGARTSWVMERCLTGIRSRVSRRPPLG